MTDNIKIAARNAHIEVILDAIDNDLTMFVWTYRKRSRDLFNPHYGTLHRIIAARKYQRTLTRHDVVVYANNDRFDMRRDNIEVVSRTEMLARQRMQRSPVRDPRYITKLVHLPSGAWRVIKDGSMHTTEAAAIAHLEGKQ